MSRYIVDLTLYGSARLDVSGQNPQAAVDRALRVVQEALDAMPTVDGEGWTVGQLGADGVTTARGYAATGWENP